MALSEVAAAGAADVKSKGHLSRAFARLMRKKVAVACLITLAIVYSAGIFAAVLSPYDYREQDYSVTRTPGGPPGLARPPSFRHWAGTDLKGRDVLTRTLWGIQNTVIITVVVMATGGLVIGVTLGLVSGYFSGRVDSMVMRTGEVFSSFPDLLLMIFLASTLRPRILDWVRWL